MLLYRLEISFFLTASWAKERESPRLEMMKAARMAMMAMMMRISMRVNDCLLIEYILTRK
jgi:hypothetical protein